MVESKPKRSVEDMGPSQDRSAVVLEDSEQSQVKSATIHRFRQSMD